MNDTLYKCPQCGQTFNTSQLEAAGCLIPVHGSPGPLPHMIGCPGSLQVPRKAEKQRITHDKQ